MSDYVKTTDFAAKDALAPGTPAKVITGTAHDNEYNAIATAVATKANAADAALTGTPTTGGIEIGFRKVPSVTSAGETAAATAVGKCLVSTGAITIPNSVFAAGDSFAVYNNSAAAIAITQGAGVTLRWAGTTLTGSRTLGARGMVTIFMVSASEAVVTGAGLT